MTTFYATTCFYQNDQEFRCTWNLSVSKKNPTEEETIKHIASILQENEDHESTWSLDADCDLPRTINLFGLSPEEFARELVIDESQAAKRFGVTWEIWTNWDEVYPGNWEHLCNR